MARLSISKYLVLPNTPDGRHFSTDLYNKLNIVWSHISHKAVGFDVSKSSFVVETLPTCSTSPDFKHRCIMLLVNVRNGKTNILHYLMEKSDLASFFQQHNVKTCLEHTWIHPDEKEKLLNTHRFSDE